MTPAYCWRSGKRPSGNPKCILLNGHGGDCQTEPRPLIPKPETEDKHV